MRPWIAPAAGGGPCFIEALTYRFVGHSRSDPGRYRKPGELDEWKLRDPLIVARTAISERFDDSGLEDVDASVEAEIEQIIARALEAPFPTPDPGAREFSDA